ncbi:GNAT family N-acetyltransferase [Hyunsoonleella ulvae]|uniref:GNAT family N-acetyltransferase n=1 Tax=Hyunsoonleella ulvae TaxID=2799948 RepID=UPI0019399949|nr:GNAT family N-acetyltransferase [Hyunsoonleella ulvae]
MKNNPFLSEAFTSIWLEHFSYEKAVRRNNIFNNLPLIKNEYLPVYYNLGKTHTKAITYELTKNFTKYDFKNKLFILYDVPTHYKPTTLNNKIGLKSIQIVQYPGYRCHLKEYTNLNDYMLDVISAKSRRKFKSYKRKIDNSISSKLKIYHGQITNEEYEYVFSYFKTLLKKRFLRKKINNNILTPQEWAFYKKVTLPMIRNKSAALFVIFDEDKPIAITLTNFAKNVMFDVIRVFDTDYAKYRLGTVSTMQQLEWCFDNKIDTLDFSKGYYEYKKRWANHTYWYEYHLYFDSKSIIARILSKIYTNYYRFKLFLRRNDLMNYVHKILFFRNRKRI